MLLLLLMLLLLHGSHSGFAAAAAVDSHVQSAIAVGDAILVLPLL